MRVEPVTVYAIWSQTASTEMGMSDTEFDCMQQGSNIHSTLLDFAEENNIDVVIVGTLLTRSCRDLRCRVIMQA